MVDVFETFWDDAAVLAAINLGLWVLTLVIGKAWPVDFIWSSWPPLLALYLFFKKGEAADAVHESHTSFTSPAAVTVLLVWVWGCRLTYNFVARGGIGHEDWRYTDQRKQFGAYYPLASIVTVFYGQSTFMCCGTLSLYPAVLGGGAASTVWNMPQIIGAALTAFAIVLEASSDKQLDAFIAASKKGNAKGSGLAVCNVGWWAWSRHPNYCGELFFWTGLWFLAGAEVQAWQSLGPLIIAILFMGVSIDLMEVRQIERRGAAYKQYISHVPSKLFIVPPFFTGGDQPLSQTPKRA